MDLLPLGDVGVVLSDALQRQLLHQVDLVGLLEVLGLQHKQGLSLQIQGYQVLVELLTMNFCTLMGKVAE